MAKIVLIILSILFHAFTQLKVHCKESSYDSSQYGEAYKQKVNRITSVLKVIDILDAWFNDSEWLDSETGGKLI